MRYIPVLFLFFIGFFGVASASGDRWHELSPAGGWVGTESIAHLGGTSYLTTARRAIYRSDDGGANWSIVATLPSTMRLSATPDGTVVIAHGAFGVRRTVDGGASWTDVSPATSVIAVAFTPSDQSIAYAATSSGVVYRSNDAGVTWAQTPGQPQASGVLKLAVDAGDADKLYLASQVGLFRSDDGGHTWAKPSDPPLTLAFTVHTGPVPGRVFVSGLGGSQNYRSEDGGATWTPLANGFPGSTILMRTFATAADDAQTIYSARSSVGPFDDQVSWVVSRDGGINWTAAPKPDAEWYPPVTAVHASGDRIVLGTQRGPFWSADRGAAWGRGAGINASQVAGIGFGTTAGEVYAASTESGVHRSTDGGATWQSRGTGLGSQFVSAIGVSPAVPGLVVAAQHHHRFIWTEDAGATWHAAGGDAPRVVPAIVFNPSSPSTIHALDTSHGGVFTSTDSGRNWTLHKSGLPDETMPSGHGSYRDLVITHDGSRLYAAFMAGVYVSTDGGQTWTAVNGPSYAFGLATHPSDADVLYVAGSVSGAGLHRTNDGGASWTRLLDGQVTRVAIDRGNPANILAAGETGVLGSIDGGATWHPVNSGLDPTAGNGVWDPASFSGTYPAAIHLAFDPFAGTRQYIVHGGTVSGGNAAALLQTRTGSIAADLAVSVAAASHTVAVGTPTEIAFTVSNQAGHPANTVSLTISGPSTLTLANASLTGGQCATESGSVTCTLEALSAGSDAAGTVSVTLEAASAASLTLAVSSATAENAPADNSATVQFSPQAAQNPAPTPPPSGGKSGGGNGGWWWLLSAVLLLMRRRTVAA